MAGVARTLKHGSLALIDGAAASVTVDLMDGSLTFQAKNQPLGVVRDRGTVDQFILMDSEPYDVSFSFVMGRIYSNTTSGFANLTPFEILHGANNNSVTISSSSPTGEPTSIDLKFTVVNPAGANPTTSDIITFEEFVPEVVTVKEGYPNMIECSGKALSMAITQA